MKKKIQGRNEILIDATPEQVFAVLEDSSRVPEYMQAVKQIDVPSGRREEVGATRSCQVDMEGKHGEVTERCIELVKNRRISFVVERDSFGFLKMFEDFGFSFILEPRGDRQTLVALEGFYRERSLLARIMNSMMMKRKLHQLRSGILAGLKVSVQRPNKVSGIREDQLSSNA